jgi:hypothetical protein
MNWKSKSVIGVAAAVILAAGLLMWGRGHSKAPVHVVIRFAVNPADQVDYVVSKAKSARFKYLLGKASHANPFFAQQLALKPVPNAGALEVRIGVRNQDEAKRYAEEFVDALQTYCGSQVRLTLDRQTIR